jgi:hypothetical protein
MIAIADQVSRRSVPGERFAHLLRGLRRGGMVGDGDVHDVPPLMMVARPHLNGSVLVAVGHIQRKAKRYQRLSPTKSC